MRAGAAWQDNDLIFCRAGDIIVRALGSLSLSGIDKVLREGREITFVSPWSATGRGWRVVIDLPYGVTVSDVIERREKLASGLRRPLGCVWPEPAADEHAGRLVLFVSDEPLSKARQPAYPLAKAGRADLFKPVPYGTDQRGKPVVLPMMFANLLIGSIPGTGNKPARSTPSARPSASTRTARWPKPPGPSSASAAPPMRCPTATARYRWSRPARTQIPA